MSKADPIAAEDLPPHMLEGRLSAAQKKVWGKAKRRAAREEAKADEKKPAAKKKVE